jgi:outer membrane protein assembly factor BamB
LAKIEDVEQLVLSSDAGLTSYEPASGKVLWKYDWYIEGMHRVTQPALVGSSDMLIGTGFGNGTRRVHVAKGKEGWTTEDVWATKAIKPYFNDLVVHEGHMYGFDNNLFVCVSAEDGKLKWRTRGYGNGQVLALPDQDLLLVLSETGEVAILEANSEKYTELGRIKAIEGKTWNHPVVVRGKLYVRNGEEAACFEIGEER